MERLGSETTTADMFWFYSCVIQMYRCSLEIECSLALVVIAAWLLRRIQCFPLIITPLKNFVGSGSRYVTVIHHK